jgi:tRNA (guanine37-N1)-methyltransferase
MATRFDIITLFPDFFEPWRTTGVCGRAVSRGVLDLVFWNPRQFTSDVHQTVDDRPYGGGPGMVMLAQPLADCMAAISSDLLSKRIQKGPTILFSPAGQSLTQSLVENYLAQTNQGQAGQFTLVCGRYEGIDQRFIDRYVQVEISLGDFVLSGGEIPALTLLDAFTRRIPGVLGDDASSQQDSFMANLLDHPHYTRPEVFEGQAVPPVLLSGHHGKIADWRKEVALALTKSKRPDLLKK